uniref:Right handed beta helix domain-containing protein n=1 Tax=Tetradesmus obliquus TaxID=3088 RepID=A0A383W5C9_TETOB|eukprot:jgi/Sobl393_1/9017/SZX72413.1
MHSDRRLQQLLTGLAVLLVACSTAAAGPAAAAAPAAAPSTKPPSATCTINIVGKGPDAEGEIKSASIACSGSGFSMAVSIASLGKFKKQFKGVSWDADNCQELDCLITFCGSSSVAIVDSSISNVSAAATQGTLCFLESSRVAISSSSFSDNAAENGTLHVQDRAVVTLRDSLVSGSTGLRGGGAQIGGDAVFKTINSTWTGNYALYGASINVRDQGTVWITDGNVFDGNKVEDAEYDFGPAGAVVYCRAEGKIYLHTRNVISNNMASGYDAAGGGFFLQDDCALDVKGGNVFINNTVRGDNAAGGAVLATDRSVLTITDATFFNNSAQGENSGGGAMLIRESSSVRIFNGVNFTHNMVLGDGGQGGAIIVTNTAKLVVEHNIVFVDNSAEGINCQGGAINTRQLSTTIIRSGIVFKHNKASYGAGVAATGDMALTLSDAVFTGHEVLGSGGAVYLEGSFTAVVANTTIAHNRAAQGGGILATVSTSNIDSNFTLTITNGTRIFNNSAPIGGGLALVSGRTILGPGVVISDNHASQGGGISIMEGPGGANCTFSPESRVINNTAVVAGGGIFLDSIGAHMNEAVARKIAKGNRAVFGTELSMVSECLPGEVRAGAWCQVCGANLYSYNPTNTSCDICPADASCAGGTKIYPRDGYWHSSDWSTQIHRCPNPGACSQAGRQQHQLAVDGSGTFAAAAPQATAQPGTLGAAAEATGGSSSSRALRSFDEMLPARQQQQQQQGEGAAAGRQLLAQPPAAAAAAAAAAPASSDAVLLSVGPPAADGLPGGMDWQCAEGYKGNLCGSCAAGHGMRGPFRCARCISSKAAVALYVMSFVVLMVIIWGISHVTWLDNQDTNTELRISDILKVFIVYIQCMVILTNIPVEWPGSIAGVFAGLTWLFSAGNSQLLSFDCLVEGMHLSLPVAVVRQLIYLLAPVAMFIAVVLLQCGIRGAHWLWRRYRGRRLAVGVMSEVWDRIPVIVIVTLVFFYPSLIRVALSMFACYPIDTPGGLYPQYAVARARHGFWQFDMQQACWEGWHRAWALGLGLPFTLVFCVGVPVGIVVLLWGHRANLDEVGFRKYCGVLYRLYRKRCYGWEAVVAVQLVLLVLVSVFGPNIGVWHQTLLLNFLFGCFLVLLMMFRPYKFARLHNIALMAMGCLNLTAYSALSFLATMSAEVERVYKEVVGAFVLVMNMAFLLWVAYCVLLLAKQLLRRIQSLRLLSRNRSMGPKENKAGFPVDAPVGKRTATAQSGLQGSNSAAKAMAAVAAAAAAKDGKGSGSGKGKASNGLVVHPSLDAPKPVV